MRAIRFHTLGGPEVLQVDEVPKPVPKSGEVLIQVEAIGVNFIDTYQRAGLYKVDLPFTPGQEVAGRIAATGSGVTEFAEGDRVACYHPGLGGYAEFAAAPAERVIKLPGGVSAVQGAALMLQGMTAHYLATTTYPLKAGDTCLVHAAAGGVGLLLCQIAKRRDALVFGTVSTEAKAVLALVAGANEVIRYTEQDFEVEIQRLTGGVGLHVVYDSVGKTTFEKGLRCLGRRGMMVLFGQSSGPVAPIDPQLLNQRGSLFLTRPTLAHYVATRADLEQRTGDLLHWVLDGTLQLRVEHEFPMAEAAEAHLELAGRRTTGKVLLVP
jgi:NADPH2:quinone reductase